MPKEHTEHVSHHRSHHAASTTRPMAATRSAKPPIRGQASHNITPQIAAANTARTAQAHALPILLRLGSVIAQRNRNLSRQLSGSPIRDLVTILPRCRLLLVIGLLLFLLVAG